MKRFVAAAGIVTGLAFGAPAMAQTKPTIPVIVKDTTSVYWQTVLAGARKAGQDLGVDVSELGAQSESDVAGQWHSREGCGLKSGGHRHCARAVCSAWEADR